MRVGGGHLFSVLLEVEYSDRGSEKLYKGIRDTKNVVVISLRKSNANESNISLA